MRTAGGFLAALDSTDWYVYVGAMNKADVSYTRNHLSEMLSRVREGETIVIVDRQRPVVRLEPLAGPSAQGLTVRG